MNLRSNLINCKFEHKKDKRKYREMDLNVVQKILDKARPLLAVASKAKQR